MKKLLSLISTFILFATCTAQNVQVVGDRISKTSVAIYNYSKNKTTILLGDSTKLDTFKIEDNSIWLSPPFKFNPIFKLQTQNFTVTYQLVLGNTYTIFWNDKKKYWDLKKIKKGNVDKNSW